MHQTAGRSLYKRAGWSLCCLLLLPALIRAEGDGQELDYRPPLLPTFPYYSYDSIYPRVTYSYPNYPTYSYSYPSLSTYRLLQQQNNPVEERYIPVGERYHLAESHGDESYSHGDESHSHGDESHSHGDESHNHGDESHNHGDESHTHGEETYHPVHNPVELRYNSLEESNNPVGNQYKHVEQRYNHVDDGYYSVNNGYNHVDDRYYPLDNGYNHAQERYNSVEKRPRYVENGYSPVALPPAVLPLPREPGRGAVSSVGQPRIQPVFSRQHVTHEAAHYSLEGPVSQAPVPVPAVTKVLPGAVPYKVPVPYTPAGAEVIHVAAPYKGPVPYAPAVTEVLPPAAPYSSPVPLSQSGSGGSSQYHAQDESGNVEYGYSNENSSKHEVRTAGGGVAGTYTFRDSEGLHTVTYTADREGFRLI